MKYGVPYQGSKSKIAEKIVAALPPTETFIDLFAGGCAITHCAMLSGKYKRFIINDISPFGVGLFVDAIQGKYKDEKRWISKEEFDLYKNTDPYIRLCWSFGNNGCTYLYSSEIEPYKKSIHNMLFKETAYERKVAFRSVVLELVKLLKDEKNSLERLERLQSLQSLQSLERLESLQSLERLESMKILNVSYEQVELPHREAVIYCDIPYKGTTGYKNKKITDFPHDEFYSWCEVQNLPCYISEYNMPSDRFIEILSMDKCCTMDQVVVTHRKEKLFVPKIQVEKGIVTLPTQISGLL